MASPTKLAMPPPPPFQHATTLLSSRTTQAIPFLVLPTSTPMHPVHRPSRWVLQKPKLIAQHQYSYVFGIVIAEGRLFGTFIRKGEEFEDITVVSSVNIFALNDLVCNGVPLKLSWWLPCVVRIGLCGVVGFIALLLCLCGLKVL